MSCTKEEIERKRLSALNKRQNKLTILSSPQNKSPGQSYSKDIRNSPYARPKFEPKIEDLNQPVPITKVITGSAYLISESRFEVRTTQFCAPLINIFKTLPTRMYVERRKLWNFSIDDYNELMSKAASLAPYVVLSTIPSYVLKILYENIPDPNTIDLMPIETTIRQKLMPFQEEGVRFGIARRGRCMIADDMGLGKTFQALAIASYYRDDWPLLIVTTSSMRETWLRTIHENLPSVPMMNVAILTGSKDVSLVADKQTEVVIVSYKLTSMHTDLLQKKKFGVVIIDESHHLKSHKAQCTASLCRVSRHSQRVVLLSGTPALSRPIELYTQLSIIQRDTFPSYTEYGKRYCDAKQTNFGWDMTGQSNLKELQIILEKRFLIRRTKEQVLTTLEEKTRETVILDSALLQFSKEDEAGLFKLAEMYKNKNRIEQQAALMNFYCESGRVKIPAICKYINQLLSEESTQKFLVFAHHRTVIDAICGTLDDAAVTYIRIVGSTPSAARADLVDRFQRVSSCRVAVLSITAANAGITLTAARLVLFAELHWNPGILTQAESRAHRLGQLGAVRVRYLLASRTSDDIMWPMLQNKLNVLNNVGLSKDSFEGNTIKHQESQNSIASYLTPSKNKNDYIPGTNIRKDAHKIGHSVTSGNTKNSAASSNTKMTLTDTKQLDIDMSVDLSSEFEKSFFDDEDGDDLLANIDI